VKYFVEVGGEEHEVEVVERLGMLRVRYDGEPLEVSYDEVDRLGQVALFVGRRSYGVSIEGDANSCHVTVAGHLYKVEIEDERERAAHAAARERSADGGVVKSVMPGVVVTLLVEPGETVEAGHPLLILEAMKMQNEITAPAAGVVGTLHVAEGDAVAAGAALVTLSAPPEG
jgi:pyruvate carboxylase subunit B